MKSVTWKTATMHPIAPVAGLAMIAALGSSAMAQAPAKGGPTPSAPGAAAYFVDIKDGATLPPQPTHPRGPAKRGRGAGRPGARKSRPPPPVGRRAAPAARQADPERFQQPAFRLGPDRSRGESHPRQAHAAADPGRQGPHPP